MRLAERPWPDVEAVGAETDLAVLPVGSTEQHGPHAPLGTDATAAEAVAAAGIEAHDRPVLQAPTVPIGVSEEHRGFAGTLWVSEATFRDYVRETIDGLAYHGFDRVVVVNGHGGNTDALREVCARVTRHGAAYAAAFTWFEAVDPDVPMGHAGALETALLLAASPEAVAEDRIEPAAEKAADRWGEWVSGVNLAYDSSEFTENGVVGDPREATAALGERLLEEAGDALAAVLSRVADRDPGPRA